MAKGRIILFAFLLLTSVGLFMYFNQLFNREEILVRNIANIDLPNTARLIKKEEHWNNFNGDGYSLLVYNLPNNSGKDLFSNCESVGYKHGDYKDAGTQIRLVDENMFISGRSCYLLELSGGDIKLAVITQGQLIVYVEY